MAAKKKQEPTPQENGWEEVVESWDEIYTFTKNGDSIAGVLQAKVPEVGPNESTVYVIKKGDVKFGIWGSAVLDKRMRSVNPNDEVMVIYLGEAVAPKSNREYHDYKVLIRGTHHLPRAESDAGIPF